MLTYDGFVKELVKAAALINKSAIADENLLRFACAEVADRLSLYLNLPNRPDEGYLYDPRLVKIAARIVSGVFAKTLDAKEDGGDAAGVKSISDNGQSITFDDKTRNYLATADDGELFGGCARLLKPYRRVHVLP